MRVNFLSLIRLGTSFVWFAPVAQADVTVGIGVNVRSSYQRVRRCYPCGYGRTCCRWVYVQRPVYTALAYYPTYYPARYPSYRYPSYRYYPSVRYYPRYRSSPSYRHYPRYRNYPRSRRVIGRRR